MVLLVDLNISTPEEQEDVNNEPEGQISGSALLHESVRNNYECLFNMTFSTPSAAKKVPSVHTCSSVLFFMYLACLDIY
jgi:hypothetical protein